MPINPKEAPDGFYAAAATTGGPIPLCRGCWFHEDNPDELDCPVDLCGASDRDDQEYVIFLKLDSD